MITVCGFHTVDQLLSTTEMMMSRFTFAGRDSESVHLTCESSWLHLSNNSQPNTLFTTLISTACIIRLCWALATDWSHALQTSDIPNPYHYPLWASYVWSSSPSTTDHGRNALSTVSDTCHNLSYSNFKELQSIVITDWITDSPKAWRFFDASGSARKSRIRVSKVGLLWRIKLLSIIYWW